MKLVRNTGTDRVVDFLRPELTGAPQLDIVTTALSIFAFAELRSEMAGVTRSRLVVPKAGSDLGLLGSEADRAARNRMQGRWLARRFAAWVRDTAEVKRATGAVPQGAFVVRDESAHPLQVLLGSLAFSTEGLGVAPGNPLNLIQVSETHTEA